MIFGNENISTYSRPNWLIWITLAFQGGLLNVGGLLAAQTFVSHVTGFATLAGVALETNNISHFFGLILMPISFLLGSSISGFLIDLRIKLKKQPRYFTLFGLIFLIMLLVIVLGSQNQFGFFGSPPTSIEGFSLVCLLCVVCGLQNGSITSVSKSVIRTTHLTGITTDLGIGIIRYLYKNRLAEFTTEGRANFMRVSLIFSFIGGSVIGVPIFKRYEYYGFVAPGLISLGLFMITLYFQVVKGRKKIKS